MFLTPPQYNGYPVSQNDFKQTNTQNIELANQKKNISSLSSSVGTITQVKHLRDGKPYAKIKIGKKMLPRI